MLFLKTKRANEGKSDFNHVAELDDYIEEFMLEINNPKAGLVPGNAKGGLM